MGKLSAFGPAYMTADATITQNDIPGGKIGYGALGKLVGAPNWDDSVLGTEELLLNFNGTDGDTTTTDEAQARTITFTGNAQIDEGLAKFGSASLLLDGVGDYITTPYVKADFDWWTGDFTIDCWVRASSWVDWSYNSGGEIPLLIGNNDATGLSNYWKFGVLDSGVLSMYYYNGSSVRVTDSDTALPLNQWNHIAMVQKASSIYLLANGIMRASAVISGTPQSNVSESLTIGAGNNSHLTGSVDALRITRSARFNVAALVYNVPTTEPSA